MNNKVVWMFEQRVFAILLLSYIMHVLSNKPKYGTFWKLTLHKLM